MKEIIVTGKHYRVLADSVNNIWHRISYWTKASDVEFDDGSVLEGKVFGHCILERNKDYAEGDIAYCTSAPSWVRLNCIVAGTTNNIEPEQYAQIETVGETITDGTAQFVVSDIRPTNTLSDSPYQVPSAALVKSVDDRANTAQEQANQISLYVGEEGQLHFRNAAGADSVIPFNPHGATYKFAENANGSTIDLGNIHKNQFIDATNVYKQGFNDGVQKNSTSFARITYKYHHHTVNSASNNSTDASANPYADTYESSISGGCFTVPKYLVSYTVQERCGGSVYGTFADHTGKNQWYTEYRCRSCGKGYGSDGGDHSGYYRSCDNMITRTHSYWTTNASDHPGDRVQTKYICGCGKVNGQIAEQIIDFA